MKNDEIQNFIKETVSSANRSSKEDNTDLVAGLKRLIQDEIATKMAQTNIIASDIKDSHMTINRVLGEIKNSTEGINKRLDTLNSSVTKHEMRLASQDVLNAQMTITQSAMTDDLRSAKASDKVFDEFRISFVSSLNTFKWLFGILGIGNLIIFAKIMFGVF